MGDELFLEIFGHVNTTSFQIMTKMYKKIPFFIPHKVPLTDQIHP